MNKRTASRHRPNVAQGNPWRTGAPAVGEDGKTRLVAGRKNAVVASHADQEAAGFAGAVIACMEAVISHKDIPDMKLSPLVGENDGLEGWARPSKEVRRCLDGAGFKPILLAIAAWDFAKTLRYDAPHGNMGVMSKLMVMQSPSKKLGLLLRGKPKRHPAIDSLIRRGASTSEVLTVLFSLIEQGAIQQAQSRLTKDGMQLHRWAKGLYGTNQKPRLARRTGNFINPPPRHLLDLTRRMLCHWRKHPQYDAAKSFVGFLVERVKRNAPPRPPATKASRELADEQTTNIADEIAEGFANYGQCESWDGRRCFRDNAREDGARNGGR
jgi:hypothetical protein